MFFIDFNQTFRQEFEIKKYIKIFFNLRLQGALIFLI
jgi:hypothetical protein